MGLLRTSPRAACSGCAALLLAGSAGAQIATDGSVGPRLELRGPMFEIPAALGKSAGPNLLHSFQQFGLRGGEQATFTGPPATENVIARVTGGSVSELNGTLRSSMPKANFYLVNPAGVIFGPEAKLDVGGSFAVATADHLRMADGTTLSARPHPDEVLSVAPPAAFGFLPGPGSDSSAKVEFHGSRMKLPPGADLTVVAGGITVDSGSRLNVPDGRVQLAAVAGAGEVPIAGVATSGFDQLGQIVLKDGARMEVGAEGNGGVTVRAQDLTLDGTDGFGTALTGLLISATGGDAPVDSEIDVRGVFRSSHAGISVDVEGNAHGGDLRVRAQEVRLDHSFLTTQAVESGTAGNLDLQAERIELRSSTVGSDSGGTGIAGNITVRADSFAMLGGDLHSSTTGAGNAGSILIKARELVLDGRESFATIDSESFPLALEGPAGAAGEIVIQAQDVQILRGWISSSTYGTGKAGDIHLSADRLLVDGAGSFASITSGPSRLLSGSGATGSGGDIDIDARRVEIVDGGTIASATDADGRSGNIHLKAEELRIDHGTVDSGAFALNLQRDDGIGGNIEMDLGSLEMVGGEITSATWGVGAGGKIDLHVRDSAVIEGGTISSAAEGRGNVNAKAGDIFLEAGTIDLFAESSIRSATTESSRGGDIHVVARESMSIDGGSVDASAGGISARAGSAGNITLSAPLLRLSRGGEIRSSSDGFGAGGNITLEGVKLLLQGPDDFRESWVTISSSAEGLALDETMLPTGAAGNIQIRFEEVQVGGAAEITTSTGGQGRAGNILIEGGRLRIEGGKESFFTGVFSESLALAEPSQSGSAGNIQIRVADLEMNGFGSISSSTDGAGRGGSVEVQAGRLRMSGTDVGITTRSRSEDATAGRAGDITVRGRDFELGLGSEIASDSAGPSDAGSVRLSATDRLRVEGGSVSVGSARGNAGSLTLESDRTVLVRAGELAAKAWLDGGNIRVRSAAFWLIDSELQANAELGNGGNVTIKSDLFLKRGRNDINVESQNSAAFSGSLVVDSVLDLASSWVVLPGEVWSQAVEVREGCVRRNPRSNSLLSRGKGGLAATPDLPASVAAQAAR